MTENPGEQQGEPGEPGYWQQQPPQAQYGQPGYGPGYGQPAYPPAGYGYYAPRPHPEASKAMTLGLVALIGGMVCWLPVVIGPWAWAVGSRVQKEIQASQGQWGGLSEATTGKALGIVSTVLLALGLLVVIVAIIAIIVAESSSGGGTYV